MTQDEFVSQMDRIRGTFGERNYSQERIKLLWEEFRNEGKEIFSSAVKELVLSQRTPPLVKEFRLAIAKTREANWNKQKKAEAVQADNVLRGNFTGSDVSEMVKIAIGRPSNKLSNEDLQKYLEIVKRTALSNTSFACFKCQDEGVVLKENQNGNVHVFRCSCLLGRKKPEAWPIWNTSVSGEF